MMKVSEEKERNCNCVSAVMWYVGLSIKIVTIDLHQLTVFYTITKPYQYHPFFFWTMTCIKKKKTFVEESDLACAYFLNQSDC